MLTGTLRSYDVPYMALAEQAAEMKTELVEAFVGVLDSGRYVLGAELATFEREFAAFCGTAFALGVGSGTCALHLTLRALGLRPGDEVITAPNSFVATAAAIVHAGGRPVFADIAPDLNIDANAVAAAVTPRTRAIIPVHLTGRPANMPALLEIAEYHNLVVIEDAAQAIGARLQGQMVGTWGRAACFSLHPRKTLHAFGDGGLVTTMDRDLLERLHRLRNHGLVNRDQCDVWGFNSRLDEVQAALLRVQLRHLDHWTDERRRLATRYNRLLARFVDVPQEGPDEFHVYQMYVVQAERRDGLYRFLTDNGIEAVVPRFRLTPLQPAARSLGYNLEQFPHAAVAAARSLSLPIYPGLTEAQQDRVVEVIERFYRADEAGFDW
jgi:dTDP-4-amino-4,6-dideoxygalactose transaminase